MRRAGAVGIWVIIALSAVATAEAAPWQYATSLPQARAFDSGVRDGTGTIWVIGGTTDGSSSGNDGAVFRLSPSSGDWELATHQPTATDGSSVAFIGGQLYIAGGETSDTPGGSLHPTNQAWRYTPDTNTWTQLASLPSPRAYAAGASAGGNFYVVGGSGSSYQPRAEAYRYSPATNTWKAVKPLPIKATGLGAATGLDGLIYVTGGAPPTQNGRLFAYNPTQNGWQTLPRAPKPRGTPGVARTDDGRIIVVGGENNGTPTRTTQFYSPTTHSWTLGPALKEQRYYFPAVRDAHGQILAIGGADGFAGGDCCTPTVERLNP